MRGIKRAGSQSRLMLGVKRVCSSRQTLQQGTLGRLCSAGLQQRQLSASAVSQRGFSFMASFWGGDKANGSSSNGQPEASSSQIDTTQASELWENQRFYVAVGW